MNKEKVIQEIMGKELEKLGFSYVSRWSYERMHNDIRQEILICHERFTRNCLKMYFSTNAYGQKPKELEDFVPDIQQESWEYRTEDEFRKIIHQFTEWTLNYGIKLLEEISMPTTEVRPKPETNRILYDNHEELNRKYRKELGMEEMDTVDTLIAMSWEIEQLRMSKKPFAEVEEMLIGLAAILGHSMDCYDGKQEWIWDDKNKTCKMEGRYIGLTPLRDIILNYDLGVGDYFLKRYVAMLYHRNTSIEAHKLNEELVDVAAVKERIYCEMKKLSGENEK